MVNWITKDSQLKEFMGPHFNIWFINRFAVIPFSTRAMSRSFRDKNSSLTDPIDMKLVEEIKVLTILEGRNLHMSHKFCFGIAKSRTNWKSHLCNLNVMFNSMEHNFLLFVYDVYIDTVLIARQHNKDEVGTNGNEVHYVCENTFLNRICTSIWKKIWKRTTVI